MAQTPSVAASLRRGQIQTLQLEAYDDANSVRNRLRQAKAARVLLIFPQGPPILTRRLDLLLIQREAARRQIQLALLCSQAEVLEQAAKLNISCFQTLKQARSYSWKQGRTNLFPSRQERPRDSVQHPYELMGVASRLKPSPTKAQNRWRIFGQAALGLLLVGVLLGGGMALIPSATIQLRPAVDAVNQPISITADPQASQIDVRQAIVPAQQIRLLVTGDRVTIAASGRRQGNDLLALGEAEFSNNTAAPLFIPAGTVVSTSNLSPPVRFQTLEDTPLAANSQALAKIQALQDSQGLVGNLEAGQINRVEGQFEALVSVSNPRPSYGGGLVELAIVTQEDHSRLVTLARQAVLQSARTQLLLQLPTAEQFLVPDSILIVEERAEWFSYSAQVGDEAESVSLEMRAAVQALVVDELLARQLALLSLARQLPPGRELDETSFSFRRLEGSLDATGRYQFQLMAQGELPFGINPQAVAERVNGMSVSQAQRTLEAELLLDPRSPPQIQVYPFNWGRMPLLPIRIRVEVIRP
jgi:hypothetical protein